MSTKTVQLLVFLTLLVHGIGHLQGVVASLGIRFHGSTSTVSWIIKGLGEPVNRWICLVLYAAAAVLGILTALSMKGLILPVTIWENLAISTAIVSTFCLVLFPHSLAMFFNKAGAIAVNLLIYYSVLFNGHWPSAQFE